MSARHALVVRGGWEGHRPDDATELFLPFLESEGFTVRIEGSSDAYADADLMERTDLIVQCMSRAQISDEALRGLRAAVANGTGLAGWHGGIVDTYRDQSDYLQLIGGRLATHPARPPAEQKGEVSDCFLAHTIDLTDLGRSHEITRGMEDFTLCTEQYWVLHDDLNDVLATTTHAVAPHQPWRRPVTSPAVWTREWGDGRVFVATPGHALDVLRDANVKRIIQRGLLWASR